MVGKPKVEDYIGAYASTYIEPTETEIALVKANLDKITSGRYPHHTIRKDDSWECGCTNDEMFLDKTFYQELYVYDFHVPEEFSPLDPEDEERIISILQCSNCGKWALAD